MNYIGTPIDIRNRDGRRTIFRALQDEVARLDNLVELVVFTPRGSFTSDPDFGFEYWNHEYANVHFREFNNGQGSVVAEVTKQACEDSVRESILAYEPGLKQMEVVMELKALSAGEQRKRKTLSRYEVVVHVDGLLDNGLGTTRVYSKMVSFLMEPTAKKMSI